MAFGRLATAAGALALLVAPAAAASPAGAEKRAWPKGVAVVGYRSSQALAAGLARFPARIVRRLPALHAVEVRPAGDVDQFTRSLARVGGIAYAEPLTRRASAFEPALTAASVQGGAYEWQFAATREKDVPDSVLRAAASVTIAVVDTGADLGAPDLAAKAPSSYSLLTHSAAVTDANGHGTFVSSLAAGSVANGEGIAGFGGDAKLLVVQAGRPDGYFTDVDEATAIVYAVDHGAKIVNLSLGGTATTSTEQNAINYAADHGVLVVAAAGNSFQAGNPVMYPAALLQPDGSNGQGGKGLAVGASNVIGARAAFSNTGSYLSLAAPGERVFGAISSSASSSAWPQTALPGSSTGAYGYASGTSFAAPEVAGAAALVWAANPRLTAGEVAAILKATASGRGTWNAELGYGVIDVAAAVARAQGVDSAASKVELTGTTAGSKVRLRWSAPNAALYRLTVRKDGGPDRVLIAATTGTSAEYGLELGHRYSFTAAAIDSYGLARLSTPFAVTLVQVPSALALRAARTAAKRFRLAAVLKAGTPSVSSAGRPVVLESFDGSGWRRIASATTAAGGQAVFNLSLGRRSLRVRARFAGAADLAAAASPATMLRAR